MTDISLSEELKTLNNVSESDSINISSYIEDILSSNVLRSLQNNDNEIKFDLGIGFLFIRIFSDSIQYNFEPSKSLQEKIAKSSTDNENFLVSLLDEKISLKLYKIYREILK